MKIIGWAALAVLLVVAGALLLPACGIRLGSWSATWCPVPAVAAAVPAAPAVAEDLAERIVTLERTLAERPICAPVGEARAVAPEPAPEISAEPAPEVPEEPTPGTNMEIPEDETDLSFLRGCWDSSSILYLSTDQSEVRARYCFDADGNGELTWSGRMGQCRSAVTAQRVGTELRLRYAQSRCSDGSSMHGGNGVCRPTPEGASCDFTDIVNGRPEPERDRVNNARMIRSAEPN